MMPETRRCKILSQLAAAGAVLLFLSAELPAQSNWPRWRGPNGDGQTSLSDVPVRWDAESIVWKAPLPGIGQSSPIVWENRIFLTAALDEGRKRIVFCIDAQNGNLIWEQTAWTGEPEKIHPMNSWASATCATDGEVVVAFFGKGGLHAFTLEGTPLWSRDLGPCEGPWGTAASPVIAGNLVIQNADADVNAFITGIDKRTGETVWTTPRPNTRGWSTPIIVASGNRQELVVNGHTGVTAYDPATGKEFWFCKSFAGRGEPTITPVAGLLCAVNGNSGDIYAIRPGGDGNVTETHMAWHTPRRGGRDIPSPIVVDQYVVVVDIKGIGVCYEGPSGRELWKERMCEAISSSPIAAGGLTYFQDEQGETLVVKPGPKLDIVARNSLGTKGEIFRASLAPLAGGKLLARSQKSLYCIGGKQ